MRQKTSLNVIIAGGGLGGLCLAQGLSKQGINCEVYERDTAAFSRPQGYRIHISPAGSVALRDSLPSSLFSVFDETCGEFGQGFSMMTQDLGELLSFQDVGEPPIDPVALHRSVSRVTLRRLLLTGLEDRVHFGRKCTGFELNGESVTALFADGTSATGDVLVGADGVNSAIRRQFLPNAEPYDTGVTTIGGSIPLTAGVVALLPVQMLQGPVLIAANQPASLFMGLWKRDRSKDAMLDKLYGGEWRGADEQAETDYVIFGYAARHTHFEVPVPLSQLSQDEMHNLLRKLTADWHPNVRKLVELLDTKSLGCTVLKSSRKVEAWQTNRVTLLGDAIHSMTPFRGIGANIALKDAAQLSRFLAAAESGEMNTLEAIAEYEACMRQYAFAAVHSSLQAMEHATGEKGLGFTVVKTAMRVVNTLPAVKRKIAARVSAD